jgi:predicted extracellular nuclease
MEYLVAFWNLENLFAPEDYPEREPWIAKSMKKDLTGWTDQLFQKKLQQLASIIGELKSGAGPDLLGVCEVENKFALEKLAAEVNGLLPARDYGVVHVDSHADQRGIDTAFIYDKKVLSVDDKAIFSHFVMRRTGTRDITQATFKTNAGNELVALANHWPSRAGNTNSAGFRMTAGETLGYWHKRIREEKGKDVAVLAMGDFNDEPGDASVVVHANASRERDDIENCQSARFYNVAWNYLRQAVVTKSGHDRTLYGTLYFGGNGNLFDQILVSKSLLKGSKLQLMEDTARIEAIQDMVADGKNDGPIRFGLPKGDAAKNVNQSGFSDHFPVSVKITETSGT